MAQRIADLEMQLTSQLMELKEARNALDENSRSLARKEEQLMVKLHLVACFKCPIKRRRSIESIIMDSRLMPPFNSNSLIFFKDMRLLLEILNQAFTKRKETNSHI